MALISQRIISAGKIEPSVQTLLYESYPRVSLELTATTQPTHAEAAAHRRFGRYETLRFKLGGQFGNSRIITQGPQA
jgi:hypothetical protein